MKINKKTILSVFLVFTMLLTIVPTATITASSDDFADLTADALVAQMGTGWNLGNTFDAHQGATGIPSWLGSNPSLDEIETMWLGGGSSRLDYVTTKSLIQKVKAEGFDTIRIPVTWFKVADRNNNWKIREDWMARIKEVVDWAVDEEMFIILNSHHDDDYLKLNVGNASESDHAGNEFLTGIWGQIADTFKDYDEKLIFEGLNEPRNPCRQTPCRCPEWNGGTAVERENLNRLNQAFVNTVRESGGNNEYRILMVPTYAAGSNNNSLLGFKVPDDSAYNEGVNKMIMSVHTYSPFNWAHDGNGSYGGKSTVTPDLNRVKKRADELVVPACPGEPGVPLILGEWGSITASSPESDREIHADDYITASRERGIVSVWWDNGSGNFGIFNRPYPHDVRFPGVIKGIQRGLGGNIVNSNHSDVTKGDWFFTGMKDGKFLVKGLYYEYSEVYNGNYSNGVYGYELEIAPAKNVESGEIEFTVSMGDYEETHNCDIDSGIVTITVESYDNLLPSDDVTFELKAAANSANFYVVSLTFLGGHVTKLSGHPIYFYDGAVNTRTFDSDFSGDVFGWDVEVWNENAGDVSMTVNRTNPLFDCEWTNTFNSLFRAGEKMPQNTKISDLDDISLKYKASKFQSNDTSYLCVYGWLENPLIEWYIVDNWHDNYRPGGPTPGTARAGSTYHGTVTADGGIYDIYTTTRINQPSIQGTKTFTQVWSVRHAKRTEGTVDVSAHFNAWNNKISEFDLNGYLYEVSMTVEGHSGSSGSSGSATLDGLYLKYGNTVTCSHPNGNPKTCNWCVIPDPPCVKCGKSPCECLTVSLKVTGGPSFVRRHVSGTDAGQYSINPELIKAVRFTFNIPNYTCGPSAEDPTAVCNKQCLSVVANTDMGWNAGERKFCYKEQPTLTINFDEGLDWL
ncbi:MAG: cellulase family glycosylhydrolase, partial [Oscillospiraceae bacterium]|nr:cellulase family glycosylhydrolase [Oscillospiraceae bacterium]